MARISGVTIPDNKQIMYSLAYVFGIGLKTSQDILKAAKVNPEIRTKNLTDAEISQIQEVINKSYVVEGELQRIISGNIKRLKDIKSYRGYATRLIFRLAARGPRQMPVPGEERK